VLTESEAAVLNQTLAENIRNNFASVVEKANDAAMDAATKAAKTDEERQAALAVRANPADLQPQLDSYVSTYEFGVRTGGGPKLDPIEREAKRIAEEEPE